MPSPAVQPLLALLAPHVGGNPTQYMYERAFAHHNLDWRYLTFEIPPENLAEAVGGLRVLGFRGGNCGESYQTTILPYLDRVEETAQGLGAVNLIRREGDELIGENTEGKGVLQAIRTACDLTEKHIVLLGTGRLAQATAIELIAAGAASIRLLNHNDNQSVEFIQLLNNPSKTPITLVTSENVYDVPSEIDLVIDAADSTPDSAETVSLPAFDSAKPELIVVDASITPQSKLLDTAANRNFQTIDGLTILVEQAAIGFELWTGIAPDRHILREAIEEFLEF